MQKITADKVNIMERDPESTSGETKTYVECECQHLSEYAVLAKSDNRTGYEIYFYVACFLVVGACFLALLAHHLCALETTFSANLLMHMFFAVMMANLLLAVGGYVSPTLINYPDRCSVLGIFIHYFFLAQFTWMFVQACNLWRILIMNDEHTYRKFVPFFLLGWGLPVLIIIAYVFISYAAASWKFTDMYSDVHSNGDMCFMSNAYAALGSAIIPVMLMVMSAIVVFVQSYQVTPQWKCYDDIYVGRYNIKELRHLMFLFALLCLAWLFAGLHLAYGSLWMIIVFTVFNVILGLYIFVLYAILRNQMRYLCRGKYPVRTAPPMITTSEDLLYAPDSLDHGRKIGGSQQRLDLNDWGETDVGRVTPTPPFPSKSPRDNESNTGTISSTRGFVNELYDDDPDTQDFDDLIFALKTGGHFTPSEHEDQELEDKRNPSPPLPTEHYGVRRIEIADTHL